MFTRGWIRMQVTSAMIEIGKWTPGIASGDTELENRDILLLISYLSGRLERTIEWKSFTKRKGKFTVSAFVDDLVVILNTPSNEDNSL